ncbi:PREDICTED: disease resistance protein RPS6-like [Camelina sativa]|uniref:Disease resistance protein RPS6-like n=1 Tax=Camelina sativa TaxID=90675 RepID=A0ABM0UIC4_CAMSA|nr:PREDICTED: disease resistance protein RPS6-like [Camelina sativa]
MVHGMSEVKDEKKLCESCLVGKQKRQSFPKATMYRASKPLKLLHADLCGPITPSTLAHNRYIFVIEMFCRDAFRQNFPPDGLMKLASEVALCAGNLPLGLKVLGSYLRGRDKEDLMDMLPRLRNGLDGKVEKTLRVSYDGLNDKKDKAIFRHVACLFNGEKVNNIKLLLAHSGVDVNIGLKNLVEMHYLLQEMGKEIVRAQSNEPGEREFLMDSKDICDLLEDNTGTKKIIGISLDMDEIDELRIHESAFKEMHNLLFLEIYTKEWYQQRLTTRKWDQKKGVRWHLPEGFDYLPHKLRLLRLDDYPRRCMPSNFCPQNLVKLQMQGSKLERLWEGVYTLGGLKKIDLKRSIHLKEISDLSMATILRHLILVIAQVWWNFLLLFNILISWSRRAVKPVRMK